jgi:hypothetical protein
MTLLRSIDAVLLIAVIYSCAGGTACNRDMSSPTVDLTVPPSRPVVPTSMAQCPDAGAARTSRAAASAMPQADPTLLGARHAFFKISVVDAQTQLPIAGARLTTVSKTTYTTDDNGIVAFYEPGSMDRDVWFSLASDGYSLAADAFGFVGARLHAVESGSASIAMSATGAAIPTRVLGDLQTRLSKEHVPSAAQCMTIRIVDRETGRGIPLVTLALPAGDQISDSQGIVAYCDPDHMAALTVPVTSHGYASDRISLQATAGGSATLPLQRINIAERLYRVTGEGVYRDSLLLGLQIPIHEGGLNGQVVGQDSVIAAVYDNQLFWTWGDTNNLSYPLGSFDSPAATSQLMAAGGLDAEAGVDLTYLGNPSGFVSGSAPDIAPTDKPTWLGGLVSVKDQTGTERLFASYTKPNKDLSTLENGLVEFNDSRQVFEPVISDYPIDGDGYPSGGQAIKFYNDALQYVYFGSYLRIRATAEALVDRANYELFSPFQDSTSHRLDRQADTLNYQWRKAGSGLKLVAQAISDAGLGAGQSLEGHLRNVDDGTAIAFAAGSITWNEYRGRFMQIGQQKNGSPSSEGEIWYAEADTPMGPWLDARKIVTHNDYTFYNPYTHSYLSNDKGKTVYFEGTYTTSFSGAKAPTPRYDYNQILYRLDLDDPRLPLPVPVYAQGDTTPGQLVTKHDIAPHAKPLAPSFLAPDRQASGTLAVGWNGAACDSKRRLVTGAAAVDVLFYALPADANAHSSSTVALYEYTQADGRHIYAVDPAVVPTDYVRASQPLAYVWSNPIKVQLPIGDFQGDLIVSAGADQCVEAGVAGEFAAVSLHASSIRKGGAGDVAYRWHVPDAAQQRAADAGGACDTSSGQTLQLSLPRGVFRFVVDAEDSAGDISSDSVVIEVQ